ncbi:MAG: rhodanese-like domain-containing protein [Streptococcaceae bacterium]|jgi:rhodanese-related sulfurtransferase|nr:rhodanese-like domain-containing protein [Streptococcaceae bacterium]
MNWLVVFELIVIVALIGYMVVWPIVRPRMVAKLIDNQEFNRKISENAQLIDVREAAHFRQKHIMGARNIPVNQIKDSLSSFRKDKDILLYENNRISLTTSAAAKLKKAGFKNIYILKTGLVKWGGKVKQG